MLYKLLIKEDYLFDYLEVEKFTKAMVASAFGLRQDGNILAVTLKNCDEIKSNKQRTKEERFAEMVPEIECIISTIK